VLLTLIVVRHDRLRLAWHAISANVTLV